MIALYLGHFVAVMIHLPSHFYPNVSRAIKGYHRVNTVPVKESTWEAITVQALNRSNIPCLWKPGSHKSGADIHIQGSGYSLKTTKLLKKSINLSSYRLTQCNDIDQIVDEVDNVRNNFDEYWVLGRKECKSKISYHIFCIPSQKIKASNLRWQVKLNKDKTKMVGYTTNVKDGVQMEVVHSMASQLWIKLDLDQFQKYQMGKDIYVDLSTNKYDYIDLCSSSLTFL